MIARLLIGSGLEQRRKEIAQQLRSHIGSGNTDNHPDILYFSSDSKLGIAEARKIKEHFSLKPYSAKGRAVVLEDGSILTLDAQNALLKTLEELPGEGLFIMGAASDSKFLPTVLSRCQVERLQEAPEGKGYSGQEKNLNEDIKKLLDSKIEERFEYVEKLKDKEEFLQSLIKYFREISLNDAIVQSNDSLINLEYTQFLKELLEAEKWQKQNVNIRAILEYLMLVMPQK